MAYNLKGLYVVATPIGNLQDLTHRAIQTLKEVDFIAAEDTRVTAKILNHLDIKKQMVAYHAHNLQSADAILDRIAAGESCALCTDAGTPAISDPGELIVRDAHQRGIDVVSVPGPCALIAGLSISGMQSGRFCFEGFLSTASKARKEHLEQLLNEKRTMIFYEAPHKLLRTLKDFYDNFGDRDIAILHELTKIHEYCLNLTLSQAVLHFEQNKPKGEFVLILAGKNEDSVVSFDRAVEQLLLLTKEGAGLSAAAKEVAGMTGYSRSKLYNEALKLR